MLYLSSNAIIQMNILNDENLNKLKENQILIGVLNPYLNEKKLKDITSQNINCFSLELLPRITRAQSMDILSSQANLAGYKAVVDSFAYFQKAIPMMMTAAGTISAAKVFSGWSRCCRITSNSNCEKNGCNCLCYRCKISLKRTS